MPYLSEIEHDAELDLLREVEGDLGTSGVVPPASADANIPPVVPAVDPGVVATPVPADEQPPAPTFGAIAPPEEANAFSGVTPN